MSERQRAPSAPVVDEQLQDGSPHSTPDRETAPAASLLALSVNGRSPQVANRTTSSLGLSAARSLASSLSGSPTSLGLKLSSSMGQRPRMSFREMVIAAQEQKYQDALAAGEAAFQQSMSSGTSGATYHPSGTSGATHHPGSDLYATPGSHHTATPPTSHSMGRLAIAEESAPNTSARSPCSPTTSTRRADSGGPPLFERSSHNSDPATHSNADLPVRVSPGQLRRPPQHGAGGAGAYGAGGAGAYGAGGAGAVTDGGVAGGGRPQLAGVDIYSRRSPGPQALVRTWTDDEIGIGPRSGAGGGDNGELLFPDQMDGVLSVDVPVAYAKPKSRLGGGVSMPGSRLDRGEVVLRPSPSAGAESPGRRGGVSMADNNPSRRGNTDSPMPSLHPLESASFAGDQQGDKSMHGTGDMPEELADRIGYKQPSRCAFYVRGRRIDPLAWLLYLVWDIWKLTDPIHLAWDLWMLCLMLYIVFVVPYLVAFSISTSDLNTPIAIFDLCVNCFFLLDVLINFRTAYADLDGKVIMDRMMIAKHYLTGWFWVDLLTSLPYDNIIGDQYGILKVLKLARMLRFIKVLRLFKLLKLVRLNRMQNVHAFFEKLTGHHAMRMLLFVAVAFSLVHWAALTFYYVAQLYPADTETWVTVQFGVEDADGNWIVTTSYVVRYITAIYWAVTTMVTVGYGDVTAVTVGEKMVAIFTMVIGASMFGYFMGSMATLVAALNGTDARVTRKKAAVTEFIRHRKIPRRLSAKISNFYSYILDRELHSDEADIIVGLPNSLRMQVVWHLYREALEKVPFFQGKHPQFITSLVTYLKLEYYSPGDIVVRQGNHGSEMYFIGGGQVEVRLYDENIDHSSLPESAGAPSATNPSVSRTSAFKKRKLMDKVLGRRKAHVHLLDEDLENLSYRTVGTLGPGQYFGEYTCLMGDPRVATVVATAYCELYSLSRNDLELVVAEWPELAEDLMFLVQKETVETDALGVRQEMGMALQRSSVAPPRDPPAPRDSGFGRSPLSSGFIAAPSTSTSTLNMAPSTHKSMKTRRNSKSGSFRWRQSSDDTTGGSHAPAAPAGTQQSPFLFTSQPVSDQPPMMMTAQSSGFAAATAGAVGAAATAAVMAGAAAGGAMQFGLPSSERHSSGSQVPPVQPWSASTGVQQGRMSAGGQRGRASSTGGQQGVELVGRRASYLTASTWTPEQGPPHIHSHSFPTTEASFYPPSSHSPAGPQSAGFEQTGGHHHAASRPHGPPSHPHPHHHFVHFASDSTYLQANPAAQGATPHTRTSPSGLSTAPSNQDLMTSASEPRLETLNGLPPHPRHKSMVPVGSRRVSQDGDTSQGPGPNQLRLGRQSQPAFETSNTDLNRAVAGSALFKGKLSVGVAGGGGGAGVGAGVGGWVARARGSPADMQHHTLAAGDGNKTAFHQGSSTAQAHELISGRHFTSTTSLVGQLRGQSFTAVASHSMLRLGQQQQQQQTLGQQQQQQQQQQQYQQQQTWDVEMVEGGSSSRELSSPLHPLSAPVHILPFSSYHPPTLVHQPSSTSHHPPTLLHQPSSASHYPPTLVHQPPSALHQPPYAMHQPSPAAHHAPSPLHQPALALQPLPPSPAHTLHSSPLPYQPQLHAAGQAPLQPHLAHTLSSQLPMPPHSTLARQLPQPSQQPSQQPQPGGIHPQQPSQPSGNQPQQPSQQQRPGDTPLPPPPPPHAVHPATGPSTLRPLPLTSHITIPSPSTTSPDEQQPNRRRTSLGVDSPVTQAARAWSGGGAQPPNGQAGVATTPGSSGTQPGALAGARLGSGGSEVASPQPAKAPECSPRQEGSGRLSQLAAAAAAGQPGATSPPHTSASRLGPQDSLNVRTSTHHTSRPSLPTTHSPRPLPAFAHSDSQHHHGSGLSAAAAIAAAAAAAGRPELAGTSSGRLPDGDRSLLQRGGGGGGGGSGGSGQLPITRTLGGLPSRASHGVVVPQHGMLTAAGVLPVPAPTTMAAPLSRGSSATGALPATTTATGAGVAGAPAAASPLPPRATALAAAGAAPLLQHISSLPNTKARRTSSIVTGSVGGDAMVAAAAAAASAIGGGSGGQTAGDGGGSPSSITAASRAMRRFASAQSSDRTEGTGLAVPQAKLHSVPHPQPGSSPAGSGSKK